jgi:large conductance mechanosensitive channel
MNLISEFKTFIQRGNVIDLAVGVIIGAAFGKIVNSLVSDVLMPPLGFVVGRVNFSDLGVALGEGPDGKPVVLKYGSFLQATFDFLIIAFCVFLLVKAVNTLQRKKEAQPPEPSAEEKLLAEIRDLLKAKA